VLVASDDMKRMNVEQLDDAFRLDVVDASTLVWKTGMNTWRRLGSLAGLDEEQETVTKQMTAETLAKLMPPPPPPPLRPRSLAPAPPRPAPPRPAPAAAFKTQQFAAPLVTAPMYVPQMPQLYAPDPYALPKRRAKVSSEVDFRRKPGGVRIGRWLVGFLLLTVGVLACYRQNLLREGARRIGIENKYLYGEKRVLGFVTAKAPGSVQNALTRLKLLPGPNAVAEPAALTPPRAVEPAAPVAPAVEPPKAAARAAEPDVKTVSLDSLPVLNAEATTATASEARSRVVAPSPKVASKPAAVASRPTAKRPHEEADERPAAKAKPKAEKVAKAEPKEAPEPKAKPVKAEPPPAGNESFLKAAIRSAIAQDAAKGK
jgi:hypothetical protein